MLSFVLWANQLVVGLQLQSQKPGSKVFRSLLYAMWSNNPTRRSAILDSYIVVGDQLLKLARTCQLQWIIYRVRSSSRVSSVLRCLWYRLPLLLPLPLIYFFLDLRTLSSAHRERACLRRSLELGNFLLCVLFPRDTYTSISGYGFWGQTS